MRNKIYQLRSFGYVEIGDEIWFPNMQFNALVKINKLIGHMEIVDKFPNYGVSQKSLYSTVCHVDRYLVFVPCESEEIAVYDIETREFTSVSLEEKVIKDRKPPYFINAYVSGNYVYMFPTGAACIIKYDVNKQSIKCLENEVSTCVRTMPEMLYCFYQQFEVVDQRIYIPFLEWNAIAIFDLLNENVDIRNLNIKGGCSTINYINGFFYLASWKAPAIYCWDANTESIRTYQDFPKDFTGEPIFICACHIGDELLFFPEHANMIISFCVASGKICEVRRIQNLNSGSVMTYFAQSIGRGGQLLTVDMNAISSFIYTKNKLEIKPYCPTTSLEDNKKEIDNFLLDKDNKALEGYLEEVLKNDECVENTVKKCNNGQKIFEQIRIS